MYIRRGGGGGGTGWTGRCYLTRGCARPGQPLDIRTLVRECFWGTADSLDSIYLGKRLELAFTDDPIRSNVMRSDALVLGRANGNVLCRIVFTFGGFDSCCPMWVNFSIVRIK